MQVAVADLHRILPTAAAVAALRINERVREARGVSIPRAEMHVVVRFGPAARAGVDVHVLGARDTVHRKLIGGVQRTISARLQLGAHEAVLGVPASALAGAPVALEELWGKAATRELADRLAQAPSTTDAAFVLESAIADRSTGFVTRHAGARLSLRAAGRLGHASVRDVAAELSVSERHLRRVFHETVGVSPKIFARLARFRRALRKARERDGPTWATVAAFAGYYDQAHLIGDFHDIAGATPQAFIDELRSSSLLA